MRHWNGLQSGGQGLASDFDAYFKTLSDMDKEVSQSSRNAPEVFLDFYKLSPAIQEGNVHSPKSNGAPPSYPPYSLDRTITLEEG